MKHEIIVFFIVTVCRGSSLGLSHQGSPQKRYNNLRTTYTNCTFVDGNLEIVFLDDPKINYDLSFLKDIQEITGYLLITAVYAEKVPLTNLRIIRGKTLYESMPGPSQYSLFVALNYHLNSTSIGMKELGFTSLHGKE